MEQRLDLARAKLDEVRQTNQELHNRVAALELENSRLACETASWHSLEASVRQLNEQFAAFQLSYACDVDKLAGLLLEVQSALAQRRNSSLLHRLKLALARKPDRHNRGGEAGIASEHLARNSAQLNGKRDMRPKDATR
jgi:hypothetical protein